MEIEFYFDVSCPFAYIASERIESIAAEAGAALRFRPMLLGGVFRAIGGDDVPMSSMSEAKARHNILDMHRWADALGVPFRLPPAHPMRTVRALRALLSLPEAEWPPVIHGLYRAYWQRGDDITSVEVVRAVLAEAGITGAPADRAVAANDDPAIKAALRERTDEAVSRGVFGAPTMFVHVPDQARPYMFWGQDRLHMVRAVLRGWRPEHGAPPWPVTQLDLIDGDGGRAIDFWYDFSSPFSYLACTQIERIAQRANARLRWRPMLLGALFKDVGTPMVPIFAMSEAKRRFLMTDLGHWAAYWGVPFRFASHFPQRTITALRLALLAGERIAELSHALFRAAWVEDGNLEDEATLARVLTAHGFDAQAMLARTQDPEVKQWLVQSTAEARAAGVFGAPTCVVRDQRGAELFWGQDRLELAHAALRGWRPQSHDPVRLPDERG